MAMIDMMIDVQRGLARASLGLMLLTCWAAAAPLELTGAYTSSTEFVTAASRETSTRPGAVLELRLTITEAGGVLTGFLDAQVQRSILRFAFPVTGVRRSNRVDLTVQVDLCLERPMVRLVGEAGNDGTLTFAATSQTITCNFAQVYLQLPRALRLLRQVSP